MSENGNPYVQHSGTPKLLPSVVCYADILGYKNMVEQSIDAGDGEIFLARLHKALTNAYQRIYDQSKLSGRDVPLYAVKVFTDNVVVGYPVYDFNQCFGECEIIEVFTIFLELQTSLAMEGFFLRGGIAFGEHYMDDNIVFGNAFLDAYNLDKHEWPPRLSLSNSLRKIVRSQIKLYGRYIEHSPHYHYLLCDTDGTIYLHYLKEAYSAFPDFGIFFDLIEGHKLEIEKKLDEHKRNISLRSKFEWAAHYHNFICRDFARRYSMPTTEDADGEKAVAAEEAQKLLNYLINIEDILEPSKISFETI